MKPVPTYTQNRLHPRAQLAVAAAYFCVLIIPQLIGGYGIFRDELYYIACANHLAFGYVDQPPLSIWLLSAVIHIFGDALITIRIAAALIGAGVIYTVGSIARELGGGRFAQWFAMLATASVPGLMTIYGFYSMNVIDHLFWTLAVLCFLRLVNSGDVKWWLIIGLIAGLGLENKYSMAFLIVGLGVGLLITGHHRLIRTRHFLYGAAIAVFLFIPHLIWEFAFGWPTLVFIANAKQYKIAAISPLVFLLDNLLAMGPTMVLIWGTGLIYLLVAPTMKRYRFIAVSYIVIFVILNLQVSKAYYLMAAYPPLFAAGAVAVNRLATLTSRQWIKALAVVWVAIGLPLAVSLGTPLLPPPQFVRLSRAVGMEADAGERNEQGALPQYFADRFGWRDLAATVAGVYYDLAPEEREHTIIWGGNYGEAGAIDYYGPALGLPHAYSTHNSYWLWGPPKDAPEIIIFVGVGRKTLEASFESVEARDTVRCDYCMPYEDGQPVFICRGYKYNIVDRWPQLRYFI